MLLKKNNKNGNVIMSENVYSQIALRSINKCRGDAWLSTPKGKLLDSSVFVSSPDYSQAVEAIVIDDTLFFTVFIIYRFGKSIKAISGKILKQLRPDISQITDLNIGQIKVKVTGIKSKKIAKRNIEIVEETYD